MTPEQIHTRRRLALFLISCVLIFAFGIWLYTFYTNKSADLVSDWTSNSGGAYSFYIDDSDLNDIERRFVKQAENVAELQKALRLYYHARGVYPISLDELLEPTLGNGIRYTALSEIPNDLYTDRPFEFRRSQIDRYVLTYTIDLPPISTSADVNTLRSEFVHGVNTATEGSFSVEARSNQSANLTE